MTTHYVVRVIVEQMQEVGGEMIHMGEVHGVDLDKEYHDPVTAMLVARAVAHPEARVEVSGGCVIDTTTNHPELEIEVLDYDVEGA